MGAVRFWTADRIAELEKLRIGGMHFTKIARVMGVSQHAVSHAISTHLSVGGYGGACEPPVRLEAIGATDIYGDMVYEDDPRAAEREPFMSFLPSPTARPQSSLAVFG